VVTTFTNTGASDLSSVPNPYYTLTWSNAYVITSSSSSAVCGYLTGTSPSGYAIYNGQGTQMSIYPSTSGCYFGISYLKVNAARNTGMTLFITG
jgi:hypothetical protein